MSVLNKYITTVQNYNPQILNGVIAAIDSIHGWFLPMQAALAYVVGTQINGKIVELGSWQGKSTVVWGLASPPRMSNLRNRYLGRRRWTQERI